MSAQDNKEPEVPVGLIFGASIAAAALFSFAVDYISPPPAAPAQAAPTVQPAKPAGPHN